MNRQDTNWLPLSAPAAQLWALDDAVRAQPRPRRRLLPALRPVLTSAATIVTGVARTWTSRLNER